MSLFTRLLLAAPVVATLISCNSSKADAPTDAPTEVPVVTLTLTDTVVQQAYVATIQAIQNTEIRSRAHGFLDKILVDEGKAVRKGQPLFQLSTSELNIQVAKSKANLALAKAEAMSARLEKERVAVLVNKQVVTKTELDLAQAKVLAADAKVQEAETALQDAELKLSFATIRAPFDGLINRIPLKVGSLIEAGTLLTTISDLQSVFTYFKVSESDYLRFKSADPEDKPHLDSLGLVLSDGNRYPFVGRVETQDGEIDPSAGALSFRARFANPQGLLKHGATGKIMLSTHVSDALLIPHRAVFEVQDRYFVYVVDKDNIIRQRSIEMESRLDQSYWVRTGLQPGERIVLEGVQNLREGKQIKPKAVPMPIAALAKP